MLRTAPAPTVPRARAAPPSSGDPGAHLGLRTWKDPHGAGTIAYAEVPGARVTAGVPRAALERLAALFSAFSADCRARGLRPVHFGVPGPVLEFLETPVGLLHLGDLPVFDLARWGADASQPSGIRAQARRAARHGARVRHLDAPPHDPSSLIACRDAWLRAKPLPPLGFMTTPFHFDPWPAEGVFVAERDGDVIGFLVASRALFGDVLRVDAVARVPGAPNGTAELLVLEAFRRAADAGVRRATLGLAPLSRRAPVGDAGWPGILLRLAARCCSPLYSFAGLEAFKAKFEPDAWVPLYCVGASARLRPADTLAVARAFAGGSLRRYMRAALVRRLRAATRAAQPQA